LDPIQFSNTFPMVILLMLHGILGTAVFQMK